MRRHWPQRAVEPARIMGRMVITVTAIMQIGKEMPGGFTITGQKGNFILTKRILIWLPVNQLITAHMGMLRGTERWKERSTVCLQRKIFPIRTERREWFTGQTTWLRSQQRIKTEMPLFLPSRKRRAGPMIIKWELSLTPATGGGRKRQRISTGRSALMMIIQRTASTGDNIQTMKRTMEIAGSAGPF